MEKKSYVQGNQIFKMKNWDTVMCYISNSESVY